MSALPLVTLTLTTDELAQISAGLTHLRRVWAERYMNASLVVSTQEAIRCQHTIQRITDTLNRLQELVSEEQGNDLLKELFNELRPGKSDDLG